MDAHKHFRVVPGTLPPQTVGIMTSKPVFNSCVNSLTPEPSDPVPSLDLSAPPLPSVFPDSHDPELNPDSDRIPSASSSDSTMPALFSSALDSPACEESPVSEDYPKFLAALVNSCLNSTNLAPEPALCATDFSMSDDVFSYINPNPKPPPISEIPSYISKEFGDVFSDTLVNDLPPSRSVDCKIPLLPDAKPSYGKSYPLSVDESEVMKEWIKVNLEKGFIRRSSSPYGAPCFFIKQKNKLRLCMDYRKLNAVTVKNRSSLPLISEMLRALSKGKIFSTLDLRSAYNQIRIAEEDVHKTGFVTPFGHFESRVLLFGLANAPADFQELMNEIFFDLIGVSVLVYLDDIIVFSADPALHEGHVREVLHRLRANLLFCNLQKCQFNLSSVSYLGFIVSQNGIDMDSSKIEAISGWPVPSSKTDIRSFLGLANFYRKFIKDFSHLSVPIHALLKKNAPFIWGDEQQSAFERIKAAFSSASFLVHPDEHKQFVVETDASDFALGGVLSQEILRECCDQFVFIQGSSWTRRGITKYTTASY